MAKVKIRGIKRQARALEARAKRLARIAVTDQKLANTIKNRITRAISETGTLPSGQKVKGISSKWSKRRDRLSDFNKTGRGFSNSKSNLTFTGQFLRSFKATIEAGTRGIRFIIGPEGEHKGYKLVRGGRSKGSRNADIGQGQIDQGRDYTVISEKNRQQFLKLVIGRIRREFKLRLKF